VLFFDFSVWCATETSVFYQIVQPAIMPAKTKLRTGFDITACAIGGAQTLFDWLWLVLERKVQLMRWKLALRSLSVLVVSGLLTATPVTADGMDSTQIAEAGEFDGPDFNEVLSLQTVSRPRISPDGDAVLYTMATTDWEDNRYDREIWIARWGQEPFQLTRTDGDNSSSARWSPDGRWVAFLADRGDDSQIWLISPIGGEARSLTSVEDGVSDFEWSPDGSKMAVAISDQQAEHRKKLEEAYGEYAVEDADFKMTHLWLLDVALALDEDGGSKLPATEKPSTDKLDDTGEERADADGEETRDLSFRRLTSGADFTVDSFRWSPDGTLIAFDHRPDPRIESSRHRDISLVEVETGDVRPLVRRDGPDSDPHFSPDGRWILFSTQDGRFENYLNSELAKVPVAGGEPVVLTNSFDEDARALAWLPDGIRFIALERTHRRLYRLDPESGSIAVVTIGNAPEVIWSADFSKDGRAMAFQAEGPDSLDEIYRFRSGATRAERITDMTRQTYGWLVGTREMVEWQSADGATIEGVLLKPEGFDSGFRHPLLVIIHGGPSWLSFPSLVYSYVYPVQQWLEKGAVILMPNYRGSAGYGEAFRSLNVRNLGVGDAWDVLSGVDHLIDQGYVDPERMGAMGWSQGGYISAFLTTTSDRFRGISVGAGISNWMTYYVNTDIHPFTRHYLQGTPWSDPEVYAKTSPMTYINQAVTPTLIQHGEFDRRVPTPNAYELYQGLQDVGAPVELIIYKGFGHGITKPKERLAAIWHNWRFFAEWVWGETVEIPVP
jgi:dipeptidyl aminopeptidase/acylaminoacyl peptidase